MGKILLVNNGPTAYENCGSHPVSDKGELYAPPFKWAEAVVGRLVNHRVSSVYYCPAPLAMGMAEAVARKYALKPTVLPGFDDAEWNSWKGLTFDQSVNMDNPLKQYKYDINSLLVFGFDMASLRPKMAKVLDAIAGKHENETVAIVTHRALTVIMILHLLHMDSSHYRQIAQDYGAINLFEIRAGVPSALYINDTCHLKSLL